MYVYKKTPRSTWNFEFVLLGSPFCILVFLCLAACVFGCVFAFVADGSSHRLMDDAEEGYEAG